MPLSVNISSNNACFRRPSMCDFLTPPPEGLEAAFDLRKHPAVDDLIVNHGQGFGVAHGVDKFLFRIKDTFHIRQEDELFGLKRLRYGTGDDIRIDIISFSLITKTRRGNDRNEAVFD